MHTNRESHAPRATAGAFCISGDRNGDREEPLFPTISFAADISSLQREMPIWAQQRIPSITRNALNSTAEDAVGAEIDKIRGVFDRPTPFTERSVVFPRNLRATKDHLEAKIMLRDEASGGGTPPDRYLQAQIFGGPRKAKPFEKALRRAGIMQPDEFATIAIGYRRNAYGNLAGPTLVAILSQLKAFSEVGHKMNETRRSRMRAGAERKSRYFVPDEGSSLRRGVYERVGKRIKAVLIFVRQPTYRARFDFGQATEAKARRVFAAYWQREFYRELQKATSQTSGTNSLGLGLSGPMKVTV